MKVGPVIFPYSALLCVSPSSSQQHPWHPFQKSPVGSLDLGVWTVRILEGPRPPLWSASCWGSEVVVQNRCFHFLKTATGLHSECSQCRRHTRAKWKRYQNTVLGSFSSKLARESCPARADSTQRRISTPAGVRTGLWAPPSGNFEEARLRTRIFVAYLTAFQCSFLLLIRWRN